VLLPWKIGVVRGDSMEPTLHNGAVYLISRGKPAGAPRTGEIIVFRHKGQSYIKRVAATQGETLNILRYEGESEDFVMTPAQARSFRAVAGRGAYRNWRVVELRIPAGACYVLGDNRENSLDSRVLGLVPFSQIQGTVVGFHPEPPDRRVALQEAGSPSEGA
jgi:signal peptidase I